MLAHDALDDDAGDRRRARRERREGQGTDVAMLVALEAIQMHGGIGMTDEHDIGLS